MSNKASQSSEMCYVKNTLAQMTCKVYVLLCMGNVSHLL